MEGLRAWWEKWKERILRIKYAIGITLGAVLMIIGLPGLWLCAQESMKGWLALCLWGLGELVVGLALYLRALIKERCWISL